MVPGPGRELSVQLAEDSEVAGLLHEVVPGLVPEAAGLPLHMAAEGLALRIDEDPAPPAELRILKRRRELLLRLAAGQLRKEEGAWVSRVGPSAGTLETA